MRMVNDDLALSLSQGQDNKFFYENTSDEASTVATGWFFFSLALGSLFTFTILAALSTSLYCCEKTRRKDSNESNQALLKERSAGQKLLFQKVPSTVYPTTHSVLQQEQNEVVESLLPAYRELPSTHITYPSSYDTTNTSDETFCVSKEGTAHSHLTTFQDSTQTPSKFCTTSLSPEPLANSNRSAVISIPDCICDPSLQSQSAPELEHDSSLFLRIRSSLNPEACRTSSTSGILTGENLTTQTFEEEIAFSRNANNQPGPGPQGKCSDKLAVEDGQNNSSNRVVNKLQTEQQSSLNNHSKDCCPASQSAYLRSTERRCRSSGWKIAKEKPDVQTRSRSEMELLTLSECKLDVEKQFKGGTRNGKREVNNYSDDSGKTYRYKETCNSNNLKNNILVINDSSRGASSLGDNNLYSSNPSEAVPSSYYALTFPREASILSDKGEDSCIRGASAFAFRRNGAELEKLIRSHCAGQTIAAEFCEDRGASSFGMASGAHRLKLGTTGLCRNEDIIERCKVKSTDPSSPGALSLASNATRAKIKKYGSLSKLIADDEYQSGDNEEPMKEGQRGQGNRNTTCRSVNSMRGASELGDQDIQGKCDEYDSLFESISLSFAYESPSEDEVASFSCPE